MDSSLALLLASRRAPVILSVAFPAIWARNTERHVRMDFRDRHTARIIFFTMRLWLMRHCETLAPADSIVGATDIALSPQGILRAQTLAKPLQRYRFDNVYCSNMSRALQTARHALPHHTNAIIIKEELREFDFGVFEGKSKRVFRAASRLFTKTGQSVPNGDNMLDFKKRVQNCVREIIRTNKDARNVMAVCHHEVIKAILELTDLPSESIGNLQIDYGSILLIEITAKMTYRGSFNERFSA